MRLEDYWGVGPKTKTRLTDALGTEAAIDAIESADLRALADAGITRGRATRILRRANGDAGMSMLGTSDARNVYDELLSLAGEYAVTEHAADRIRVLTPLTDREAITDRLDSVLAAREAWDSLDEADRDAVLDAFARYDERGGTERAAVETALALREAGLRGETFAALDDVDPDALREAAGALGYVSEGRVVDGADDELDRLRRQHEAAKSLANDAFDVLDTVRDSGVRTLDDFEHAVVEYVTRETDLTRSDVQRAAADDPVDAADFVSTTLRALAADLEEQVADREETVEAEIREAVETARDDVDAAVAAVDDIGFALSLARFAEAHDLRRPTLVDDGLAVTGARNLLLSGDVQPVTYGVGEHALAGNAGVDRAGNGAAGDITPPSGDRVTVLTGANSGGKTTLLETLCQVVLLTAMGLPVPAEAAEIGAFDTVVFHRRHASFNAGVLESTLKSIVPPLTDDGRALMLVDEFEAITEPGRAADLLNGLVQLTVDRGALGVYVTHLADELSPLPSQARIDGIFAEGLTQDLALQVDYQPRFGTVGKSTPEFIVSRLVANARDRAERQGFEALAAAVGEEAVQRTLSDAQWDGE
ncbi:DNA mismatch repair protein, MutS family [Halogranum gelatinilyticum]|uniref:DNA mismatch repair protein, MutS family n=1 Tax=Halogranum gelatinilyticum TaxID=660521 RepID=A0A1G9VU52_9EURY|nr:DNA mismatch repair protein [Halogranum gelatinilyticum]SDM75477.1 DNA mismatch repair protein, MutS family [Halogranum gelatinilyticum]